MSHQRTDWESIERKWRRRWNEAKLFEPNPEPGKRKAFVTFPFAYMNGPLHVGHGFTATKVDAYARFMRMQQYKVLFPWAWHWTGETIAGASERLRKGDPAIIREFREIDGVPEEELKKFDDPAYVAKYYTDQNRETVKRIGFSIDWRREFHTTSLEPNFSRFIEWQYERLRKNNYVFMGSHPVVWCPHCESPTGDHDRLEGEGASPEEYTLMKFHLDDTSIAAATFRPETIFGVTNLWVNPDGDYLQIRIDGETWIVSQEASEKLKEQLRNVEVIRRFKGSTLAGKDCIDPITKRSLPILPGSFVDPAEGSGLVYSVPAHAPFDWVALRDLKSRPESAERFGISRAKLEEIKPISMISLEDHGEFPAIEVADRLGVRDQNDPKCEEATKIVYKKEFHTGVLKAICGQYAGMKVREVKDIIIKDFKKAKIVDSMFDLPERVVCRCTTLCRVKVIQGQWFLRYSDSTWKKRTKLLLSRARIYPESARQWFLDVIDWYRDWPCARKTGLGTPLPWSPEWIVETLSDSTVYMAFYTINRVIHENALSPENLTDEVFEYIFLGIGDREAVAKGSGISPEVLRSMREEFRYWYPVDLRVSAKELLPNHLTFFLFQHAALFEEKDWPKGIGVNGMLMIESQKMSKSKGNIVTLRKAMEDHGADVTRCTLLMGADDMDDPDWRAENLEDIELKLESFINMANEILNSKDGGEKGHLEEWLTSRMCERTKKTTENMMELKTRAATENVIHGISNDFRWYLRRRHTLNRETALLLLEGWVKLMTPLAPHLSEEIWERLGKEGFASTAQWPKPEEFKKSIEAELIEEMVRRTLEDVNSIVRVTGKTPKQITFYTAAEWKWTVLMRLIRQESETDKTKRTMKELATDPNMKSRMKEVAKYVEGASKEIAQMAPELKMRLLDSKPIDEYKALESSAQFFSKELKAEVSVYKEDDSSRHDPMGRAGLAKPHRPAIYIE